MKLSIVTVCLNDKFGLEKTIKSVSNQIYSQFQFIVIDGGSSDGSIELIEKSSRIDKFISEKDNGIYDAMNKGIQLCKGDFILFLNAGDTLQSSDTLSKVVQQLSNTLNIYYGKCVIELPGGKQKMIIPKVDNLQFKYGLPFNHQSCFTPKKLIEKTLFNSNYRILGDLDFYKSIYRNHSFIFLNETVAIYSMDGISSKYSKRYVLEVKAINNYNTLDLEFIIFKIKYYLKWLIKW